jgi:hypothetical protein
MRIVFNRPLAKAFADSGPLAETDAITQRLVTGIDPLLARPPEVITKAQPTGPGSRGGTYYLTRTGKTRYGDRPSLRIRWATLHTAGPESPGYAFRLTAHPTQPGRWRAHPKDWKRITGLMKQAKESLAKWFGRGKKRPKA